MRLYLQMFLDADPGPTYGHVHVIRTYIYPSLRLNHCNAHRKLSRESVISIFLTRLDGKRTASLLAKEFEVTAKAIRDVWTQKSWASLTTPFLNLPWQAGNYLPPGETSPLAIAAAGRVSRAMANNRKKKSTKRKCMEGDEKKYSAVEVEDSEMSEKKEAHDGKKEDAGSESPTSSSDDEEEMEEEDRGDRWNEPASVK